MEPKEGLEPSTFRLRVGPQAFNWTQLGPSWLLRCGTDFICCRPVAPGRSVWVAREVAIGLCWRWVLASDRPPRPSDRHRKVQCTDRSPPWPYHLQAKLPHHAQPHLPYQRAVDRCPERSPSRSLLKGSSGLGDTWMAGFVIIQRRSTMVEVGDRVVVESEKVGSITRSGVVTAVEDRLITVRWTPAPSRSLSQAPDPSR